MIGDVRLRELAERLTSEVPGIVGVMLGGSRARDEHAPDSDVDLGLYYRPPLDVRALQGLAHAVAGPDAHVTRPGEWGPWVDGGAWLRIEDTAVDWLYRDLDRARASWNDAQAGRFRFHCQVGHPLGVPDFSYAGEIALGVVLTDPFGELTLIHRAAQNYPPRLRAAVLAGLREASFTLDIARKAGTRGDTTYIAGCLFRAIGLCAHALHAFAGRWLINEKGAVASAGRLPCAPAGFADRARGLLAHLGTTPCELAKAIDAARDLLAETAAACRAAG